MNLHIIIKILICLIGGYLFGNISPGYIVGKAGHVDVRNQGSGNLGTTNVLRVMGAKAGLITMFMDLAKTIIPVMLVRYIVFPEYEPFSQMSQLMCLYTALGCVIGHTFPFYLKFHGGKGVACMGACMLVYDASLSQGFKLAIIGLTLFIGIIVITKFVSLASLASSLLFPIYVGITSNGNVHMILVTCAFTFFVFFNHRANIVRLIHGNENKFSIKKKK